MRDADATPHRYSLPSMPFKNALLMNSDLPKPGLPDTITLSSSPGKPKTTCPSQNASNGVLRSTSK